MKKETYLNKLTDLLGIDPSLVEEHKDAYLDEKTKKKNQRDNPIPEERIQNFRAAQGLTYFFQAPELFQPKICKHCGEGFLVSRMFVAYCSYTCIEKECEQRFGFKWSRKGNIESLVQEVYEGNEPIWIKNLDRVQAVLDSVKALQEK